MTSGTTVGNWVGSARKYWAILASAAAFIVSLVGGFLQPVGVTDEERGVLLRFAPVVVTFIIGLVFLAAQKLDRKKHAGWWVAGTLLSLALFVVAFFSYRNYIYTRTCNYDNDRVVIGTSYTPRGTSYVNQHQGITCEKLLEDFAGQADDVWTAESINQSRRMRDYTYVSCVALFAISFLTLGQALYSSERAKANRTSRAPSKNVSSRA
jgi:D-alanyl-lipoteichoic acid acyltransferase DltB (MBOAT superfamily)